MSSSFQNISTLLGIVTLLFGGYYLYNQFFVNTTEFTADGEMLQTMLMNTEVFIVRRQELEKINFDTTFFEDPRFSSLVSYDEQIVNQPIGRSNPFEEIRLPQ